MRHLQTPRLRLEPQTSGHADRMFAVLCDPALYEFENQPPVSLERLRNRFEQLETRTSPDESERWLNWVVVLPDHGPIGFVQATIVSDNQSYIAYILGSNHWGKGYGSEAVLSMLDELTATYGVQRFVATYKKTNHRSHRLLERIGFHPGSAEDHAALDVESDESLMMKVIGN